MPSPLQVHLRRAFAATCCSLAAAIAAPLAAQQQLSDAEVAHVAVTANTIDIELGRFAESRAQNEQVRDFASQMVRDHSTVNSRAQSLVTKLQLTPERNDVSATLGEAATRARRDLESKEGREFDRAYIEREIEFHQAVIDALDSVLIPTAENAELKALLEEIRPAIVAHRDHARNIQQSLRDRP